MFREDSTKTVTELYSRENGKRDQMLYTEIVQSLKNAPIKSAMSAILVDTNNKKVLEETWISSIFKEYEAFPQIVSKKRQEEEMDYERDC